MISLAKLHENFSTNDNIRELLTSHSIPINKIESIDNKFVYLLEKFLNEKKLRLKLIEALNEFKEVEIYGSNEGANYTSIVSFNIKNQNFNDIATFLDQYGIMIRGGHHCCQPFMKKLGIPGSCRVSFGIYNDLNDIDHFVESMKKTLKLLQ